MIGFGGKEFYDDPRMYINAEGSKANIQPKKLKNYKDRSIYDSNVFEFWFPVTSDVIPGILEDRYFVSSKGRTWNTNTKKPIGLSTHRKGYKQFAVIKVLEDGSHNQQTKKLHRYIMETFCPIDEKDIHYEVNHIDGVKTNNELTNLEYCTSSENTIHAINHGLKTVFGNENYKVYLNYDQVKIIRSMADRPVWEIREAIGNPTKDQVSDELLRNIATGHSRTNNP